jgi:hypothetical protein
VVRILCVMMVAMCVPGAAAAAAKRMHVERTVTVAESQDHLNFPFLFRLANGDLLLSHSEGVHTRTERGRRLRSRDGGATWQPCSGGAGPCVAQLSDGRLIALGFRIVREGDSYQVQTCRSDRGESWQGPQAAPVAFPFDGTFQLHRSIVVLPNGRLLASGYGKRGGDPKYRSFVIESDDRGASWRYGATIAYNPNMGSEGFCEPTMAQLRDGRLLCVMRTGSGQDLYQCWSVNSGRDWSVPVRVGAAGVNPHLCVMQEGPLALSYGRPGVHVLLDPTGTGAGWRDRLDIYDGIGCGYTSAVELAPGRLLLTYSASSFCAALLEPGPNRILAAFVSVR